MTSIRLGAAALLVFTIVVSGQSTSEWSLRELPSGERPLKHIVFSGIEDGWIVTGKNMILRTRDGGLTWRHVPWRGQDEGGDISRLFFHDSAKGWAVGAIGGKPAIWRTLDGGESWQRSHVWPRAHPGSIGAILDIYFVGRDRGWAVGFNGLAATIYNTVDGGATWETQYSGSEITYQFKRVVFTDDSHGWVLGPNGLLQTESGGEFWRLRKFDEVGLTYDLALDTARVLWVAGEWDTVSTAKDGGKWIDVRVDSAATGIFFGLLLATHNTVWVWGPNGNIYRTQDGGKVWHKENVSSLLPDLSEKTVSEGASNGKDIFVLISPGQLLIKRNVFSAEPVR